MTKNFFTIPHSSPFIPSLVKGFMSLVPHPEERARATFYLPSMTATRSLREHIFQESGTQTVLFPRIICIPEAGPTQLASLSSPSHKRVIDPVERHSQLTHFIRQHQIQEAVSEHKEPPPFMTALHLSRALIQLLDHAALREISLASVHELVPEEFSAHWQITLHFLQLILDQWPHYCAHHSILEPYAAYCNETERLISELTHIPSSRFVIAAGFTHNTPIIKRLLEKMTLHPHGYIVLPGLNAGSQIPDQKGEVIPSSHPQYTLKNLLSSIHIEQTSVKEWPWVKPTPALDEVLTLMFEDGFPSPQDPLPLNTFAKLTTISCDTLEEESLVIALILRHALEDPHQNAALITANPTLAQYVQEHLHRWHLIPLNLSVTCSLADTSLVRLMGAILDFVITLSHAKPYFPSISFLSLLKHPLVGKTGSPLVKKRWLSLLEKDFLRTSHLVSETIEGFFSAPIHSLHCSKIAIGLNLFHTHFKEFFSLASEKHPLSDWMKHHLTSLTFLTGARELPESPETLLLQETLEILMGKSDAFEHISLEEYKDILQDVFKNRALPQPFLHDTRLKIVPPAEARFISADVMILGSMNEGIWPQEEDSDPWLSRSMRQNLGLRSLEERVGLMAHDFCQTFSAKRLFFTRSSRIEGAPSLASRFWLRLETFLKKEGLDLPRGDFWRSLARQLQTPDSFCPEQAPRPCPPLSARPQKLSVTQIELWKRDPYGLYARHILSLHPLEPLEKEFTAALFGRLVHQACEYLKEVSAPLCLDDFLDKARLLFAPYVSDVNVSVFWWPKFQAIAAWLIEAELTKRTLSPPQGIFTELYGTLSIPHSQGIFTLSARADRIDRLQNSRFEIIDYKTGLLPTAKEIHLGFSPQLPLEASILLNNGFFVLPPNAVLDSLSYWSLKGHPTSSIQTLKEDCTHLADQAFEHIVHLIERFNDPQTPYLVHPIPYYAPTYNPYTHLERTAAWQENALISD